MGGATKEQISSDQTCHRRFQQWVRSGVLKGVFEALALELQALGRLDVREAFIDGSFASAKKGDPRSGRRSVVKEPRLWPWQTAAVCLLAFVLKARLLTK